MNIKKVFLFLGLLSLPVSLFSQSGFVIGYNVGVYRAAHRNLQAYSQMYNLAAGTGLKQEMKMTGFYRGIVLGWRMDTEKFLFAFRWSTKKSLSSTGENEDGTEKIRLRMNTFNLDFAMGGESFKAGFSLDAGAMRIHRKTSDALSGKKTSWEPFYEGRAIFESGSIATGITLFFEIRAGRFFELRPYYQLPLGNVEILDKKTFKAYAHPIGNYGLSLCLILPVDD